MIFKEKRKSDDERCCVQRGTMLNRDDDLIRDNFCDGHVRPSPIAFSSTLVILPLLHCDAFLQCSVAVYSVDPSANEGKSGNRICGGVLAHTHGRLGSTGCFLQHVDGP